MTNKRRGDVADPEIVRQAHLAAGILAEIFTTPEAPIRKSDLLDRPRPSGLLRQVRDVLFGVLHHRMGISQQKIAAALGRDRGVISEAAHAIDEAATGDVGVRFALVEITEQISNLLTQADAWREALRQEALTEAIRAAAQERAQEQAVLARVDADIAAAVSAEPQRAPIRCHQCYGKGRVTVRKANGTVGDPAYRDAWEAAEAAAPAPDLAHQLTCRFCQGAGTRPARPAGPAAAAILAASRE